MAFYIIGRQTPSTTADVCDNLLARFRLAYSMVTPGEAQLDYATLSAFFRSQRGAKAGLKIDIEDMTLIAESATGATVTYRERQQLPGQQPSLRFSTVVFDSGADNQVLWRHLHETTLHL